MNDHKLGILLGFLVVGIAFTGGAAAAPITGPITEATSVTGDAPITQASTAGPITEGTPITSPITADAPITGSPITADGPITQSPITGPITQ